MQVTIRLNGKIYQTDLRRGFDLSIPLVSNASRPKCFYAPDFRVEPVVSGDFTGEVSQGSSVNFRNIMINPHGNGTHTECAGHITAENITINQTLKQHHFTARLVSVNAIKTENEDLVITSGALISISRRKRLLRIITRRYKSFKSEVANLPPSSGTSGRKSGGITGTTSSTIHSG